MSGAVLIRHTARRATAMQIMFPLFHHRWRRADRYSIVQDVSGDCMQRLKLGSKLGRGLFANTYEVLSSDVSEVRNSDIVCKVVELDRVDTGAAGGIAMFDAEVATALAADTLGVGPRLYKCWRCATKGYMLMERCAPFTTLRSGDLQHIANGVFALAKCGIIHNDLHDQNIMRSISTSKPLIIDYGMATTVSASSGYTSILRYKSTYGIDTAAAVTFLTIDELVRSLYTKRRMRNSRLLDIVSNAREHFARDPSSRDRVPDVHDVIALLPNTATFSHSAWSHS